MKGKIAELRETINDLKHRFSSKKGGERKGIRKGPIPQDHADILKKIQDKHGEAGGSEHAPKRKLREDINKGLKNPYELHDWQRKTSHEKAEEVHKEEKDDKEEEETQKDTKVDKKEHTNKAKKHQLDTKEKKPSETSLLKK